MKSSLRDLLPQFNLSRGLRRVLIGGALAAFGALGFATAAPTSVSAESAAPVSIVNRSEKKAKLVLSLPGADMSMSAQHRSHASHASHRSHSSHSSHRSSSF